MPFNWFSIFKQVVRVKFCNLWTDVTIELPTVDGGSTLQKLAKEAFRRTLISPTLNKDIEHVSVLVDSAPEILSLIVDRDEDFVQMPSVAQSTLSSLQRTSILGTELSAPLSHSFI
jgi:hypothetical protein